MKQNLVSRERLPNSSARRKPRKGIETPATTFLLLLFAQHVGNLGRGLKRRTLLLQPSFQAQHVGNLGRGLKHSLDSSLPPYKSQHVGNLGRGLKRHKVASPLTRTFSARRKPRKGIETFDLFHSNSSFGSARRKPRKGIETNESFRALFERPLSTSETSEGD